MRVITYDIFEVWELILIFPLAVVIRIWRSPFALKFFISSEECILMMMETTYDVFELKEPTMTFSLIVLKISLTAMFLVENRIRSKQILK